MGDKYEAILSCPCGFKEELSDKDYEDILTQQKEIELKCGHWKYGVKISAKHKIVAQEWRFG